jgi:hypothetical protein
MINENIRHSASYELSDIQLGRCIDALRDLLQDTKFLLHDQHAQAAVNKLNQVVPVSKSMKILPVWSAACLNCTATFVGICDHFDCSPVCFCANFVLLQEEAV